MTPSLTQYGPVIAAGIALVGVLVTLAVTTSRGRREALIAREDAYRQSARAVVVDLLVAANEFQRHGRVMSSAQGWVGLSYEHATEFADSTEASMKALDQKLSTATLMLTDEKLQQDLVDLESRFERVAYIVHETIDAFWGARQPNGVDDVDRSWAEYSRACFKLRDDSARLLRPTIRSGRALRRSV